MRNKFSWLLFSTAACVALILSGVTAAVPRSLAASGANGDTPPKQGKTANPNAPNSYGLSGDTVNTLGTNQTTMQTNWGLDGYASWEFYGAGTTNTGAALGGFAYNANHGIGVWGDAPNGTGVKGTSSVLNSFGVQGSSDSGIGVAGLSNNADGVKGTSVGQMGVHGISTNYDGVRGESTQQTGVYGKTVKGNGVWGITTQGGSGVYAQNFSTGWGVLGQSDGGKGVEGDGYSYGVYGRTWTTATSGIGVVGYSPAYMGVEGSGKYWGVYGTSSTTDTTQTYAGVYGYAYYVPGVYGYSGVNAGVYGSSSSNAGVYGKSSSSYGVYGKSTSGYGVYGNSDSNYAVVGISNSNIALRGTSNSSYGAYVTTGSGNIALRAVNPSKAAGTYAAYFDGNVRINGSYVATGTKSALVFTSQGARLMYAEEATQNYFSDQGTAQLKDGRAVIKIDPLFAQTVSLDVGYQLFLTPGSFSSQGLAYGNLSATSFEVRELNGGKGSYSFTWRVTALRKGYEKDRMAAAPADELAPQEPDLPQAGAGK